MSEEVGERRRRRLAEKAAQAALGTTVPMTRRELRELREETDAMALQVPASTPEPEPEREPTTTSGLTRRELREIRQREAAAQAKEQVQEQASPAKAPVSDPPVSDPPGTPHRGVNAAMAKSGGWPAPAPNPRPVVPPPDTTGPVTRPDARTTGLLPKVEVNEKPNPTPPARRSSREPVEVATGVKVSPLLDTGQSTPVEEADEAATQNFSASPSWKPLPEAEPEVAEAAADGAVEPVVMAAETKPEQPQDKHRTPRILTVLMVIVLMVILVVLGLLVYRLVFVTPDTAEAAVSVAQGWVR